MDIVLKVLYYTADTARLVCTVNREPGGGRRAWLGCRLLRLLAAPLLTPGTSSSSQTPSDRHSRPLSHVYEDNLAERGDKRQVELTLHGVPL